MKPFNRLLMKFVRNLYAENAGPRNRMRRSMLCPNRKISSARRRGLSQLTVIQPLNRKRIPHLRHSTLRTNWIQQLLVREYWFIIVKGYNIMSIPFSLSAGPEGWNQTRIWDKSKLQKTSRYVGTCWNESCSKRIVYLCKYINFVCL